TCTSRSRRRSDSTGERTVISIGRIASRAALSAPDSPALIAPEHGVRRTFGELEQRAELLGRALLRVSGAHTTNQVPGPPAHRVGALSRNWVELMELYLGTAKAGGMLFPLNWRLSPDQIVATLTEATPSVVFYETEFSAVVEQVRTQVNVQHWVEWEPGAASSE